MDYKRYSLSKGMSKALLSLLAIAGSFVALAGFSDITLWSLVETHLKPLLGAFTVGGAITLAINWIKFHTSAE